MSDKSRFHAMKVRLPLPGWSNYTGQSWVIVDTNFRGEVNSKEGKACPVEQICFVCPCVKKTDPLEDEADIHRVTRLLNEAVGNKGDNPFPLLLEEWFCTPFPANMGVDERFDPEFRKILGHRLEVDRKPNAAILGLAFSVLAVVRKDPPGKENDIPLIEGLDVLPPTPEFLSLLRSVAQKYGKDFAEPRDPEISESLRLGWNGVSDFLDMTMCLWDAGPGERVIPDGFMTSTTRYIRQFITGGENTEKQAEMASVLADQSIPAFQAALSQNGFVRCAENMKPPRTALVEQARENIERLLLSDFIPRATEFESIRPDDENCEIHAFYLSGRFCHRLVRDRGNTEAVEKALNRNGISKELLEKMLLEMKRIWLEQLAPFFQEDGRSAGLRYAEEIHRA